MFSSQAAIKALDNCKIDLKLVWALLQIPNDTG
jgi:hypothetical protein